jgi:membrane protein implicated in regulation of membrane protease activity
MNPAEAIRLTWALSLAGLALLALEIWFPGGAMAIFGTLSLLGAIGVSGYVLGFHIGAVLLSGAMTVVSIGFLLMLVYFPDAPLAKRGSATRGCEGRGKSV